MEDKKKLCKFMKELKEISPTNDCCDSSYTLKIKMRDSCKLQEETNDATLRT